ncbi:cupin domain-containing protein [Desulfurivibrio sp. D14AmB]|uniref:cupin domain-containing protein n=1 Tax=Desulfurivibrio sp. D14AmB TaxID=3374370 RepID=UPI00376EFA84
MKKVSLNESNQYDDKSFKRFLLHDSPYFRVLNFNLKAGQVFPVHSHPAEGQLTIQVVAGSGEFLGADATSMPAESGDILVSEISEPHGVKATTDMRILVTIAPPF